MGRPLVLVKLSLEAQSVPTLEGYPRGIVMLPKNSQVLFLGPEPPDQEICLFILTPMREPGPDGQPRPYAPDEVAAIELAMIIPGQPVDPETWQLRAPVRTEGGMVFLFERKPKRSGIILPGGQG